MDGPATMLSLRDPIDVTQQRRLEELDVALTRLDELGGRARHGDGRHTRSRCRGAGFCAINRSAEALFGIDTAEMVGKPFTDLLAEESRQSAADYLDGLARNGVASVLNDGREVIGRVPAGRAHPACS